MNQVNLVGRLTREPELRYSQNGTAFCTFTLAVDRAYQKKGEEKKTDFIPVYCIGSTAENSANYLTKGKLAGVSGSIQVSSWEKDGQKQYRTEVFAERVEFLSPKGHTEASDGGGERAYGHEVQMDGDDVPF